MPVNKPPRRNPFASSAGEPVSPVDTMRVAQQRQKPRRWEQANRAFSYAIPRPLHQAAWQVRDNINAIAQFDEHGTERDETVKVDEIACALIDWALRRVEQEPEILTPRPDPTSRGGQMTLVTWRETAGAQPISLPAPRRKRTIVEARKLVLSYRWSEDVDAKIRELAGKNLNLVEKYNPYKHAVPAGEVVVRLLELAISDYIAGRFVIVVGHRVTQDFLGWESK